MKNIFKCLLCILIIPLFVFADTYSTEEMKANNYLNSGEFATSDKYLISRSNLPSNLNYYFITRNEFVLSKVDNLTYLFDVGKFWLNSDGIDYYVATSVGVDKVLPESKIYNGRTTEYVKNETKVSGKGTYLDPWTFDSMYSVFIKSNEHADIVDDSENNKYVLSNCKRASVDASGNVIDLNNDCGIKVAFKAKTGYQYLTNYCEATRIKESGVDYIIVDNVKRNTECEVIYGTDMIKITLGGAPDNYPILIDNPEPDSFYLKYGIEYYESLDNNKILKKIKLPTYVGYTSDGYQYLKDGMDLLIIDADGNLVPDLINKQTIKEETQLTAIYHPNKYTVIYNGNGGTPRVSSQVVTYDSTYGNTEDGLGMTVATRAGYSFDGWFTEIEGGTKVNATDTVKIVNDITLYAHYIECQAGNYSDGTSATCSPCPLGTYQGLAAQASCSSCPSGYSTENTGSTLRTQCRRWNSCKTGENTCQYGCDSCTGDCNSYLCTEQQDPLNPWYSSIDYSGMTVNCKCSGYASKPCNCDDCKTGHNTCQGGWDYAS